MSSSFISWEVLFPKFTVGDGCWEWSAAIASGYGHIGKRIPGKQLSLCAHRVVYEKLMGSIPKGLQLDHLCRNTKCVRPDHLEPVTPRTNSLRGVRPLGAECARGHDVTEPHQVIRERGGSTKRCRACREEWLYRTREKRAETARQSYLRRCGVESS